MINLVSGTEIQTHKCLGHEQHFYVLYKLQNMLSLARTDLSGQMSLCWPETMGRSQKLRRKLIEELIITQLCAMENDCFAFCAIL